MAVKRRYRKGQKNLLGYCQHALHTKNLRSEKRDRSLAFSTIQHISVGFVKYTASRHFVIPTFCTSLCFGCSYCMMLFKEALKPISHHLHNVSPLMCGRVLL